MTVTIFWLSLGILTLIFLIILLIFYIFYRREIKVKTESTAKVMGEVVAFYSKNQLLIYLPVVEYQVGAKDIKRPLPTLISERLLLSQDKPMFSIEPMFLEQVKI